MIVLVLILALVLRLINLNQSLWLDEAVQAVTAQKSLSYLFQEITGDFHPPAFHLLMHYWVKVFGASEIVLRLPSVLFGVGTVGMVYLIIKKLTNSKINALAGAFILASAPFHVYYSQEARMYSMATFLVAGSMYFFLKINELNIKKLTYLGYFLFTLLALYTDYYAFLVLLAQGVYLLIKKKPKFIIQNSCLPAGMAIFIILFYLPWLPMLVIQLKTGILAAQILPGWGNLVNVGFAKAIPLTFVKFSLGRIIIFNRILYVLVSGSVLAFYGWLIFKNYRKKPLWLFLWLVIPIVVAWLASLAVPNYQPFRLILVLPAFYLLAVLGIFGIKSKSLQLLTVGAILLINLVSLSIYWFNPYFHREDWRGVAKKIEDSGYPIVISSSAFNWPLVYYDVGNYIIDASHGVKTVSDRNEKEFMAQVGQVDKLFYTPYLADVYDPSQKTLLWLKQSGFVKMNEYSFNQIPVWEYELTD